MAVASLIYSARTHFPLVKICFFVMHHVFDGILCHIYVIFTSRLHHMYNAKNIIKICYLLLHRVCFNVHHNSIVITSFMHSYNILCGVCVVFASWCIKLSSYSYIYNIILASL
jgi:hypothetical protein